MFLFAVGEQFGLELGDWPTWLSGVATTALFAWTLHVWRAERTRAAKLDLEREVSAARSDAQGVAAWVQKGGPALRARAGVSEAVCPDGAWVACVANEAYFAVYEWRVDVVVKSPASSLTMDGREYGPLPPRGGCIVKSLPGIRSDAAAQCRADIWFRDARGWTWATGASGLERSDI